jgi:hypothetical protein
MLPEPVYCRPVEVTALGEVVTEGLIPLINARDSNTVFMLDQTFVRTKFN